MRKKDKSGTNVSILSFFKRGMSGGGEIIWGSAHSLHELYLKASKESFQVVPVHPFAHEVVDLFFPHTAQDHKAVGWLGFDRIELARRLNPRDAPIPHPQSPPGAEFYFFAGSALHLPHPRRIARGDFSGDRNLYHSGYVHGWYLHKRHISDGIAGAA
jgi:hypothetical protein